VIQDLHHLDRELQSALDFEFTLDDDEKFRELLHASLDLISLDPGTLACAMGVSLTTVLRWKNGNAIPYPVMRRPVYRFLRRKVSAKLTELAAVV